MLNHLKKWLLYFYLILLFACTSETATPTPASFNRNLLLNNITHQIILPTHETFEAAAKDLLSATQSFTANPNDETLTAVQKSLD